MLWNRLRKMSMATQVLISLAFGVAAGLFFGEMTRPLHVIGDAFVRLLQMAVLPYIVLSLVTGVGSLTLRQGNL